ncbi:MAG: cytochrome c [Acidobacteria bacterium]|nr:cytochrome c [Acidobacteriota bacterium]
MSRKLLNAILFLALLGTVLLHWAVRRDITQRNREFIPEMVRSVPYDSFAPNPSTPDGKTLQVPVPGTIPRGYLPIHYQPTPEDAKRAGEELTNPYSASDGRALDRGSYLYFNFCQTCHGPIGMGDGAVVLRGFPAPPSLTAPNAMQLKDGQIFHILTYGQKNMAAYASQLSREDRWKVILYVRSLQKPAGAATTGGQP